MTVSIENLKSFRAGDCGAYWEETEVVDLAISQAETIRVQGEEIERLRLDSDRAFSMLELYGVPKTRARYLSIGIDVLVSRYDKEVFFLNAELSKVKQERDEAYTIAARICHLRASKKGKDDEAENEAELCTALISALKNLRLRRMEST